MGSVGTGKTHLAIALGVAAIARGHHVAFWRASDLVRALTEARDARLLGRLHDRLARVAVLVLDELGFVPFDKAGGELLFDVLSTRHERAATIVTSTKRKRRVFTTEFKADAVRLYNAGAPTASNRSCWGYGRRKLLLTLAGGTRACP